MSRAKNTTPRVCLMARLQTAKAQAVGAAAGTLRRLLLLGVALITMATAAQAQVAAPAATATGTATATATATPVMNCQANAIAIQGRSVWVDLKGAGKTTVMFEAGGGNESSVWSDIAPRIQAAGVRTLVYDRAGLGKSGFGPEPYGVDNEVATAKSVLTACGISGPVILVAHSYGGVISLLLAGSDSRIAGVVLVEALVPKFLNQSEMDSVLAKYRPQYDEIRKLAPGLAKSMIPLMEAMPTTAKRLDAVNLPKALPIIDIVAENTTIVTPQTTTLWRIAHASFVAGNSKREAIFAAGSSHKVMKDKPDLVVSAIEKMIGLVGR